MSDRAELQWIDPEDTTLDAIVFARWAGTKVVRKVGSAPTDPEDGVLVIDSRVRNQYKDKKYVDLGLEPDTTYYYRFFTYTDTGVLNTDFDGITKVQTKYFSEVFGENTFEQIHFVISQNMHKEIWNIGDKIKIWFNAVPGLAVQNEEYPSGGYTSFDVPSGYVEFMIADFDRNIGWKDEDIKNKTGFITSGLLKTPDYNREENPRNVILVQSSVSEMLTFARLGEWNYGEWLYPYSQAYLEQWLMAKGKFRDLSEEEINTYFYDIDYFSYYESNLDDFGGAGTYVMRDKMFRVDDMLFEGYGPLVKRLAVFPDKASLIFKKESGEAVHFWGFDTSYSETSYVYLENGDSVQKNQKWSPEYSRIWCALK